MGRASRVKGQVAEREVAKIISETLGIPMLRRTPLSGGMDWKGDVVGWDGYHVEVKRQERLSIPAWIKQAEDDCPPGSVPLVIYRQSHQPWRVVITLNDLLTIITNKEKQHDEVS